MFVWQTIFSCIRYNISVLRKVTIVYLDELIRPSRVIGGGIPESRRAFELSDLLGVKILPSQV